MLANILTHRTNRTLAVPRPSITPTRFLGLLFLLQFGVFAVTLVVLSGAIGWSATTGDHAAIPRRPARRGDTRLQLLPRLRPPPHPDRPPRTAARRWAHNSRPSRRRSVSWLGSARPAATRPRPAWLGWFGLLVGASLLTGAIGLAGLALGSLSLTIGGVFWQLWMTAMGLTLVSSLHA